MHKMSSTYSALYYITIVIRFCFLRDGNSICRGHLAYMKEDFSHLLNNMFHTTTLGVHTFLSKVHTTYDIMLKTFLSFYIPTFGKKIQPLGYSILFKIEYFCNQIENISDYETCCIVNFVFLSGIGFSLS